MPENDPASLCRAMPDRQVMLKGSGVRLFFCSVLSTQYLSIGPEPNETPIYPVPCSRAVETRLTSPQIASAENSSSIERSSNTEILGSNSSSPFQNK
jgi:hypothetical protein